MRSSKVLTMMPSGSDVASRAISFLTVLKNFFASAGWNSIFLNEWVSVRDRKEDGDEWWLNTTTVRKKSTQLTEHSVHKTMRSQVRLCWWKPCRKKRNPKATDQADGDLRPTSDTTCIFIVFAVHPLSSWTICRSLLDLQVQLHRWCKPPDCAHKPYKANMDSTSVFWPQLCLCFGAKIDHIWMRGRGV